MEDALCCIGRAARYAKWREHLQGRGGPQTELVGTGALEPDSLLDENESKQALQEAGINVSSAQTCTWAAQAVRVVRGLGYPVVLKAHGDGFEHKTELGAVALDLRTDQAVQELAAKLLELPGAKCVAVEPMITDTVAEIIVGVSRDATLGLGLTIGTGGILTEILADSVTLLLPVTREDILDGLNGLRGATFLDGYRGRPIGDTEVLADAIVAIAGYAESHADDLLEMDVNPILVRPRGSGVIAVDALIRRASVAR